MMRTILTIILLCAILNGTAEARMYQWTSPVSDRVQLSGTPPAWYRGTRGGPRVLVFDDGRLVDDTMVAVSEKQRAALRESAFGEQLAGEAGQVHEAGKLELKAAMDHAYKKGIDVEAVAIEFNEQVAEEAEQTSAVDDVEEKVAALKSLIEIWDKQQLDQARSVLDLIADPSGGE